MPKISDTQNNCKHHHSESPVIIAPDNNGIRISLLEQKVVQKDLSSLQELDRTGISDKTFFYVDDNGQPKRVLALDFLLPEFITWEMLDKDVQKKILAAVTSVNGHTGKVVLKAEDLGAITKVQAEDIITDKVTVEIDKVRVEFTKEFNQFKIDIDKEFEALKADVEKTIDDKAEEIHDSVRQDIKEHDLPEIVAEDVSKLVDDTLDEKIEVAVRAASVDGGNIDDFFSGGGN